MDPKSQLQAEYEAFMLGGVGRKTKTKPTPTNTATTKEQQRQNNSQQKKKKPQHHHHPGRIRTGTSNSSSKDDNHNYYYDDRDIRSIFKSYQGRLKEWLDDDKFVLTILESISHLRGRIRWEMEEMLSSTSSSSPSSSSSSSGEEKTKVGTTNTTGGGVGGLEEEDCGDDYDDGDVAAVRDCWKNYGFRSSPSSMVAATGMIGGNNGLTTKATPKNKTSSSGVSLLRREDIELALDHDVLQHEKMMSALRSVLRSVGQNIDTIGRRLDEWMMVIHNQERRQLSNRNSHHLIMKWKYQLEIAQKLFVDLSKDLFSKQKALEQVLSSYHERLFVVVSPSSFKSDSTSTSSSLLELQQHGADENVVRQIVKDIYAANRNVDNNSANIRSRIEEVLLAR